MDAAALDAMDAAAVAARLGADPAERARFVADAAAAGHAEAQAVLGQMLLDGDVVDRDERAAFRWFNAAAAQGHLMALNMVGRCYELALGTARDDVRAAECYRVAAERGLPWAFYNHATSLALGRGLGMDRAAALVWLLRAVGSGEALLQAKASNFVGSFAEDGWAGPVDLAEARRRYAEAAAGGDFRGCFNHARMLLAEGDADEAQAWIARALQLGNDRFRDQVGAWLAANGRGAPVATRPIGIGSIGTASAC